MNDQTVTLLTTLSNKLGTTVEHLWGVLLAQVPLEIATAFGGIILSLLFTAAFAWASILIQRKREACNPSEQESTDLMGFISVVLTFIMFVVTIVVLCEKLSLLLTLICNPEYWVLQHFIK